MFMWSEACMDQEMRVLVTLEKRAAGLASITELCLLEEEESLVQEDWRNQRFWPVLSLWWLFSLSQPSFCRGWSTADCSIAFHIRIWPLDCRHMAFKFFVPIVITHLLVSSHSQCHPHSLCEDFTRGPSGLHRRNPREWCPRKLSEPSFCFDACQTPQLRINSQCFHWFVFAHLFFQGFQFFFLWVLRESMRCLLLIFTSSSNSSPVQLLSSTHPTWYH